MGAAGGGLVEDVIVDEGGGVDEFDDDGEVEVVGEESAGSAAGEEGEGGAEPFAVTLDGVGHVGFHGGVEGGGLGADPGFHGFQRLPDWIESRFEGDGSVLGRLKFGARIH